MSSPQTWQAFFATIVSDPRVCPPLPLYPRDGKTTGTLLPGETATTSFSFKSADPGVFSDRWRLDTAPSAAFVFSTPPPPPPPPHPMAAATADTSHLDGTTGGCGGGVGVEETTHGVDSVVARRRSNQSGGGGGEGRAFSGTSRGPLSAAGGSGGRGGVEVGLRGVALAPDTRGHARKRLADGVMRGILAAKVEEIVREVVRDVHTPVREEEVRTSASTCVGVCVCTIFSATLCRRVSFGLLPVSGVWQRAIRFFQTRCGSGCCRGCLKHKGVLLSWPS